VLGRRGGRLGQRGPTRAREEEKEKACRPDCLWAKSEGRERERVRVLPFFKISFQIHFSNIQTSIKQNPCIQIMMHKNLLFLNYFSDV
jgi:hypothetical protein